MAAHVLLETCFQCREQSLALFRREFSFFVFDVLHILSSNPRDELLQPQAREYRVMVTGKLSIARENHHFIRVALPGTACKNPIDTVSALPSAVKVMERVEVVIAP